jgi:hypothetical protein
MFSNTDKVLLPQTRFSSPDQDSPPPDKVLLPRQDSTSQTRFSPPDKVLLPQTRFSSPDKILLILWM